MKNALILLVLLITIHFSLFTSLFTTDSYALTPTFEPTSTEEVTDIGSSGQVLSDEIKKIRQAVQEKVAEKLKNITTSRNPNKAWAGSITKIDSDKITINFQNSDRVLFYTADTVIIDEKRKKITSDKLKVGQNILGMGTVSADSTLDTKRIISYDPATLVKKQIVLAKIADISKTSNIIVLIPLSNKNIQYQTKTDTKTEIINKSNSKIDIKVLTPGQKVVAILTQDPKSPKTYTALRIIALDVLSAGSPTPTPKSTQ